MWHGSRTAMNSKRALREIVRSVSSAGGQPKRHFYHGLIAEAKTRELIQTIGEDSNGLRMTSTLMSLWLVLGIPTLAIWMGARPSLIPISTTLLILGLAVAVAFWSAAKHRPEVTKWQRILGCLRCAAYPPAAMMSAVEFTWAQMSRNRPALTILAVCGAATSPDLVRQEWLPLKFPLVGAIDQVRIQELRAACERVGLEWNAVVGPPDRSDFSANSYCPRCRTQYHFAHGRCSDCLDIETLPFDLFQGGC